MKIEILEENDSFLVANKPAGVLSQKDKSGDPDLAELLQKTKKRNFLHPAHRLDRNTSGILILAKSPEAARTLSGSMQEDTWVKVYLAVTKGNPGKEGKFAFPLAKDENKNQTKVDPKGDNALTEFNTLAFNGSMSLVKIRLHTGRSHQIRVHFSHAGFPLIGDRKYGKKPWSELAVRPLLHAYELSFPFGGKLNSFQASPPSDFHEFLKKVGGFQEFLNL